LVAGALARLGDRRALVVHGDDGLDELTTTTTSRVWDVRDGVVKEWSVDPRDLGLAPASREQLRGGDVARNRELADAVLEGVQGAMADLVALNAAAALLVADVVDDLPAGLERAQHLLVSGAARDVRDRWITCSQLAAVEERATEAGA
jgi:anthranilate phosphoribosyltransferase